jgi:hypothetical protein
MHPPGNVQNFEDRLAVQSAKNTRDNLPYTRVVSVDPPWLETAHFQKCMYEQVVLRNVTERIT